MYETLEFYDSNGCDLKEVLKSSVYRYYITQKKLNFKFERTLKKGGKNCIIKSTNKLDTLHSAKIKNE